MLRTTTVNTLTAAAAALAFAAGTHAQTVFFVPSADTPTLELALNPIFSGIQPGDVIELDPGSGFFGAYTVTTSDITIRSATGAPVTLNSFGLATAITVNIPGGALTLENLNIINGNAGTGTGANGGAIDVDAADELNIISCTFDNNRAAFGGAIYMISGTLNITDSAFTNNTAHSAGGAIRSTVANLTIDDSTFDGNQTTVGSGGAITHDAPATVTVTDTTFNNNTATVSGGAFRLNATGTSTLTNVTFTNNTCTAGPSSDGGGLYITGNAVVTLADSTFDNNDSDDVGGGLTCAQAQVDVINCAFTNNDAGGGGAIGCRQGSTSILRVFHSTFDNNTAFDNGGGGTAAGEGGAIMGVSGSTQRWDMHVVNSLFINNDADTGGAIAVGQYVDAILDNLTMTQNTSTGTGSAVRRYSAQGTVVVNNSIAAFNTPADSQIAISGTNLDEVNFSLVQGGYTAAGTNNIDAVPMFVDPMNGDFSLMPGSPAIDAGSTSRYIAGPLTDLAGNARGQDDPNTPDTGEAVIGATIDMGAYEFTVASTPATCPTDTNNDNTTDLTDLLAILAAFGTNCP